MIPETGRWTQVSIDQVKAGRLADELGCPKAFAALLVRRGISEADEAERFLSPSLSDMHDPFLMKDMDKAVSAVLAAIDLGEKITIYGDYDVDGITSTSILYLFLGSLGADISYYIPDRMTEGYGLNSAAIEKIAGEGTKLMITVDTGITGIAECRRAYELGMKVVVTDHHECGEELPEAEAVIDIKRKDETYPFRALAGCGTAFKLVQALRAKSGSTYDINGLIELAALGTIADVVPLKDENRIITAEGLKRMRDPRIPGIRKLLEASGYDFRRKLKAGYIGFTVAPRLNAAGRMGDAGRGVRLLTSSDETEISSLANELNAENQNRKETEELILRQVLEEIRGSGCAARDRIFVVCGKDWHHGVMGIVSSRIEDIYYRPNIIISNEDGICSGSARSIPGFNLYEALNSCRDLMIKFGGHAAAAGLSIKEENVPELRRRLNEYAASRLTMEDLTPSLTPEVRINASDITLDFIRMVEKMEPFGEEMPQPLIEVRGTLSEIRRIGQDLSTLRVRLSDRRGIISGVGFRKPSYADYFAPGADVSVLGSLEVNAYNGREYPQIIIRDIHRDGEYDFPDFVKAFSARKLTDDFYTGCDSYVQKKGKLSDHSLKNTYVFLKRQARSTEEGLTGSLLLDGGDRIREMLMAIAVFEELGLMEARSSGSFLQYRIVPEVTAKLADSALYVRYYL
ncbi:MAG: single-stranded-DNA-specific exonuclease RecJ [Lachnospiraceae bacterium]|nr:single-stranded-DNA-specific exonuclease RecJ [Lachnospiraceae bacterium]